MSRALASALLSACLLLGAGVARSDDEQPQYFQITVTKPFINMHTGPGRGYPSFYVAERGQVLDVLVERTDWYRVRHPRGVEGWITVDDLAASQRSDGTPVAVQVPDREGFVARHWEAGVMAGTYGDTDALNVFGAYRPLDTLGIEVMLEQNFGDFSDGAGVSLGVVAEPFPRWRVSPYFKLAGGIRKTEPKSSLVATEDREDSTLEVGAGVKIYLTRRLFARLHYNNTTVLTERDDDEDVEEWTIGLGTFF